MRILVTGASGFAGSQLIPRLLSDGHLVRALARDPARVDLTGIMSDSLPGGVNARARVRGGSSHHEDALDSDDSPPINVVDVLTADVLTGEGLAPALRDIDVAYYLIHSMERARSPADGDITGGRATPGRVTPGRAAPFPERERVAAENFAAAAAAAGVRRIVYLGGPTSSWTPAGEHAGEHAGERGVEHAGEPVDERAGGHLDSAGEGSVLSPHLRSREAVERILREAIPDTVALRASIVIGARSRSFRFLVRLVERMPVLTLPAWRSHRTRPIDARDITGMLAAAATVTTVAGRSLDVGGPDILSYGEMIRRIAELMMLSRPAVGLGVNATPLTARVAAVIAEEDPELVSALMGSLQTDLLPGGGPHGQSHLHAASLLGVDLHSFDSAVECSLREWEATEPLAAR